MQLSSIVARVSQQLAEGTSGPVYYPAPEIINAVNEGQRFFCLLTLGLERTSTWAIQANTPFSHMLTVFPDWICPLRITTATGAKVRPVRLDDLSSLDPYWRTASGDPVRYAALGGDFVAIYKQPTVTTNVQVTYARAPLLLAEDADVPEIPEEYQPPACIDYAVYRMRQVEGAQEFGKELLRLEKFLAAAKHYGAYVRARNMGGRYDKVPFELEKFDTSSLLKLRPDLMPGRQSNTNA